MRKIQRLAAVGAMAALTVALGACGSSATPSTTATSAPPAAAAPTSAPAASDGVTEISDIFGPACNMVPTEGPGSAAGMVDDPVATAASNNPLLTTLTTAVGKVPGLGDTLNKAPAITVYAPFNGAFAEIPAADLEALLGKPDELGALLKYHVVGKRYDAAEIVKLGKTTELAGGDVTVGGTATAPTLTSSGGTKATVLCGNIPTSNATVFVIDKVLMPKAAA